MAASLPSVHALKRVVVGLGSERALILSLEMAVKDVWASRRKHATHKPVQVQNRFVSCYDFFLVKMCLKVLAAIGLVKLLIATLVGCLLTRLISHSSFNCDGIHACIHLIICVSSGAWWLFRLQWML